MSTLGDLVIQMQTTARLVSEVLRDELERRGVVEINATQALLIHDIGLQRLTAGEIKSRGYYLGSNVSYNFKKLVETGYLSHQRCPVDGRSVRIGLTEQGRDVYRWVCALFERQQADLADRTDGAGLSPARLDALDSDLRALESFWLGQIRYIY